MNNEKLLEYLQEIITSILEEIASAEDLTEEENEQALLDQINFYLEEFGVTIEEVLPQMVIENYFGGVDDATKQLKNAGLNVDTSLSLTSSGQIARGFQRRIHMEAVQEILDDALLDFNAAIRTAIFNANNSITSALEDVKRDISIGMITGDTNRVVSKRVMDSFANNGLTAFYTKPDKRHGVSRKLPLDFYANTIVRTKVRESSIKGHVNRYRENGVNLVQISERSDTCHVCAKYDGLVVSLTGEHDGFPTQDDVPLPPYHPNCRGVTRPYVIEYKSEKEIESAKKKWENWHPDKDPRTAAQKRQYQKDQEIRRKVNEEKKQYARWKSVLGDDAPKTLGAFRRMKRQNTDNFQKMQSQYMSIAQKAADRS